MRINKYFFYVVIIGLFFVFGCSADKRQSDAEFETGNDTFANNTVSDPFDSPLGNASVPAAAGVRTQAGAAVSEKDIQQALKNAGFYQGEVDGKIGPKTKKAIEDFQAKNNLQADGKVGPMTWNKLSVYLNTAAAGTKTDASREIKD